MSGICGILFLDDQPSEPTDLSPMMEAMKTWGLDGSKVLCEGSVALGHLMTYNTPESFHETLPFKNQLSHLLITASARIDNREELSRHLNISPHELLNMPDSQIILKAYEKWGEKCPERLLGDWAFAIWDARERRLFLARDHQGNSAIYYCRFHNYFAFASSLKGLLQLPKIEKKPNEMLIAQILVARAYVGRNTCYKNIFTLPPAHYLTISKEKEKPILSKYWYLEKSPRVRFRKDSDYINAFLEIYSEAVRCRLRTAYPIGAFLSGGLDSGSVVALAANELKSQGYCLKAFSSVPLYERVDFKSRMANEKPLIEETIRYVGNVEPIYVNSRTITPLMGIEKGLDILKYPIGSAINLFWLLSILTAAKDLGIRTVLTGQGGNFTVSWDNQSGYLPGVIKRGRLDLFFKELNLRCNQKNISFAKITLKRTILSLLPRYLRNFLLNYLSKGNQCRDCEIINQQFSNDINLLKIINQNPDFEYFTDTHEARLNKMQQGFGGAVWHDLSGEFNIEARDPTFDKRVLEFCFSIPDEQYSRDEQNRLLIRRATKGLLPESVIWNTKRGLQAADIYLRLQSENNNLQLVIEKLEKASLTKNFLNLKSLHNIYESIGINVDINDEISIEENYVQSLNFLRGIMVGLFLESLD
jgi:asparagine synthase (glutamine-hydrolysing)